MEIKQTKMTAHITGEQKIKIESANKPKRKRRTNLQKEHDTDKQFMGHCNDCNLLLYSDDIVKIKNELNRHDLMVKDDKLLHYTELTFLHGKEMN